MRIAAVLHGIGIGEYISKRKWLFTQIFNAISFILILIEIHHLWNVSKYCNRLYTNLILLERHY